MQDAFGVSKGAVGRFFDRRALALGQSLAPVGSKLADGAEVTGHTLQRGRLGFRKVVTSIGRDGQEVGSVRSIVSPTKHVVVDNATVRYADRGKGIGTSALRTLTDNAPKAKTPGVYWLSEGAGGTQHGARAWKHGDARFMRGVGMLPGLSGDKLKGLSPEARKQGRRFIRRSRLGLVKPSEMKTQAPDAAEALNGVPWAARVKGGQPFLRKTTYAAGGVAVTGAGAETYRRKRK